MNAPGTVITSEKETPLGVWLEGLLRQHGQNALADNLHEVLAELMEADGGIVEHADGTITLAA